METKKEVVERAAELEARAEELERRTVDLENRLSAAEKRVAEKSSDFYSSSVPHDFKGFPLDINHSALSETELGRLQTAFLKRFPFYSLFVQGHVANDMRGKYHRLFAIRAHSCMADHHENLIVRDEECRMQNFIDGFVVGTRAFRKKKRF